MNELGRERTRRRNGGCCLLPLLALFALGAFWWQALRAVPVINVPSPVLPSPNAHDDLVAACAALIDSNKFSYAISNRHNTHLVDDHSYTPAQKEQLVAENAPALRKFHKALGETYWAPPARSFNVRFTSYAQFRNMARFLALKQQVLLTKGDRAGAFDAGLDTLQMGVQLPHGAVIIGSLVGIAIEAIGRRPMWDEIDRLNAAETRTSIRRLQTILAQRFPYRDTIQEEKWTTQAALQEVFRKGSWAQELNSQMNGTQAAGPNAAATLQSIGMGVRLAMSGGPARVLNNYSHYMDALRERARHRFGEKLPQPSVPNDPINQILSPVFTQVEFKDVLNRTEDDLLLTKLALHLYTLEHGLPPAHLEALVPADLPQLPPDLFAATGSFRYKVQGKTPLVYSIGPDGKDDGGKPALNTTHLNSPNNPYSRYIVQETSTGDIVAGVNR